MKITVFCCDLYRDAAPAFHYLWNKEWPECPYELIYITNSQDINVKAQIVKIPGKPDIQFGWRLRKFLKHNYDDDLMLLMMVDYFPQSINVELIEKAKALCERDTNHVAHVRLRPMPHPTLSFHEDNETFGKIDKRARYALSLQPGIWKAKALMKLCRDDEDPWRTEMRGSGRTKQIPALFLSTREPAIVHLNYYKKKKPFGLNWVRDSVPREFWPDAVKEEYE